MGLRTLMIYQIETGYKYSHQPYWFKGKICSYLLFTTANEVVTGMYGDDTYEYMPWKIYYGVWNSNIEIPKILISTPVQHCQGARLNTGFGKNDIECSPYAYEKDGIIYLTFIGGKFTYDGACYYHLYQMQGKTLDDLSPPVQLTSESLFAGFQNSLYQLRNWQESECEVETLETGETRTFYPEGFTAIRRIMGIPEDEHKILITGRGSDPLQTTKTILFDLETLAEISEILVENKPIYKSCFSPDGIIYAETSRNFEQRKLFLNLTR
jgi:hypothetical protein